MKKICIVTLLLIKFSACAQFGELTLIPGSNMLTLMAKHPDSFLALYGGLDITYANRTNTVWMNRGDIRWGSLGCSAAIIKGAVMLGGGIKINMFGPWPVISPDINIRLHPFMLIFRKELPIDITLIADVSNLNNIHPGAGLVFPISGNY